MKKLLYVAHFYKGSTAYERLDDLKYNFEVEILNIYPFFPVWKRSFSTIWRKLSFGPPFFNLYKALISSLDNYPFEIVFIEKNLYINLSNLHCTAWEKQFHCSKLRLEISMVKFILHNTLIATFAKISFLFCVLS